MREWEIVVDLSEEGECVKMNWKVVLPALFAAASGFALVEKKIDPKHPIEVVFSTHSHNRIAVEDGAVEKILGDHSLFSVNIDPSTGQAFVNVLNEIKEKPVVLTVVTSSGAVQDLSVRSNDGQPEQVFLKEENEAEWVIRPEVSHAATVEFLNQLLEGAAPQGYGLREWEEKDQLSLPDPLKARGIKVVEGPFEVVRIFEIENPNEKPIVLNPSALKKESDSWVYLNLREVKKGEKSICIIGSAKE
jgi:hypothetical protein